MTALNAIAAAGVAEPGSFSIGALIIGLALLVVNGAFTATEISLLASRRGLIEGQAEQGDRRAVWAIRALRDLPTTFAGTQLGVTMSSLGLGYIAEPAIAAGLSGLLGSVDVPEATSGIIAVTVALTLVVFLHMVVGDMAPKNLAITHAESVALRLAFPFGVWVIATRPLTKLLDVASRAVLWLLRVEPVAEHKLVHTPEELALVLTESHVRGMIAGQDARMMGAALRLSSIDAEAAMTSRVDIAAVPDSASVTALLDLAAASGHTRIPVYHEDLDHITGVVHIKDALILDANPDQVTVAELLRPIAAVPETRDLEHLLRDMLDGRQHVVLVVDEFGATAGLLTLEDVLEELVGDIADEFDEETVARRDAERIWIVPGTMRQDELTRLTGMPFPDDTETETVSGWIVECLGRLVQEGDTVVTGHGWKLRVVTVEGLRAGEVEVRAPADHHAQAVS